MALKLGLALLLVSLLASPQSGWCCSSRRSSSQGSDRSSGEPASDGRTTRVSGYVLLSPAPDRLPANARLEVRLQDISLMDAPSKLLTSRTFDSVSAGYTAGARIPFSLEAVIPAETPYNANSVAVSASLRGDGVSFITDTAYYVDLRQGTFDYSGMEITIVKYP